MKIREDETNPFYDGDFLMDMPLEDLKVLADNIFQDVKHGKNHMDSVLIFSTLAYREMFPDIPRDTPCLLFPPGDFSCFKDHENPGR